VGRRRAHGADAPHVAEEEVLVGDGAERDRGGAVDDGGVGQVEAGAGVVVGAVVERHRQRHAQRVAADLVGGLGVRVLTLRVAVVLLDEVIAARAVAATQRPRRVAAHLQRPEAVGGDLEAGVAVGEDGRADVRPQQRPVVALEAAEELVAAHQLPEVLLEDLALALNELVLSEVRRTPEQIEVHLPQAALERHLRARHGTSRAISPGGARHQQYSARPENSVHRPPHGWSSRRCKVCGE
jgi:hypothetical protein